MPSVSAWLPGSPEASSFSGSRAPTGLSVMLGIPWGSALDLSFLNWKVGAMGLEMARCLICAPAPRDSEAGTPILSVHLDLCHSLCLPHPHCPSLCPPHGSQRSVRTPESALTALSGSHLHWRKSQSHPQSPSSPLTPPPLPLHSPSLPQVQPHQPDPCSASGPGHWLSLLPSMPLCPLGRPLPDHPLSLSFPSIPHPW